MEICFAQNYVKEQNTEPTKQSIFSHRVLTYLWIGTNLQLDYEKNDGWERLERTNLTDWYTNLETIVKWSPYSSEADLLNQVYILWILQYYVLIDVFQIIFLVMLTFYMFSLPKQMRCTNSKLRTMQFLLWLHLRRDILATLAYSRSFWFYMTDFDRGF